MMHPDTEIRPVDAHIGLGVFATRLIPRGTITWVQDDLDLVLPAARVAALDAARQQVVHRYAWQEGDAWIYCWDHARFVNHSCEANCLGIEPLFEIALRDIQPGEQLTDDYRTLGPLETPFACRCGAASCTGWVDPTPDPLRTARWAEAYRRAEPSLRTVAQPLGAYVGSRPAVAALYPSSLR